MSHRLIYLVILLVVVAALLFGHLPVPPTYAGRTIENAGHLPVFVLVTLGLLVVLNKDYKVTGARLYATAGLVGAGLGFLSEVIQRPLARDASWEDVLADTIGVVCALALHALFVRRDGVTRPTRFAAFVVVLVCAAFYLAPLVRMARAYVHRNGQFPVLADFRQKIELAWVWGFGVNRDIVDGALDVDFSDSRFPGISLHEPVPDWRAFKKLLIDLENPDADTLHLAVRVHDRGHGRVFNDRFNRRLDIGAGERRTIEIALDDVRRGPRDRLMEMSQISDITLFRGNQEGARRMRVYSVRLE